MRRWERGEGMRAEVSNEPGVGKTLMVDKRLRWLISPLLMAEDMTDLPHKIVLQIQPSSTNIRLTFLSPGTPLTMLRGSNQPQGPLATSS